MNFEIQGYTCPLGLITSFYTIFPLSIFLLILVVLSFRIIFYFVHRLFKDQNATGFEKL